MVFFLVVVCGFFFLNISSLDVYVVCVVSEVSLRSDGFCLHTALWRSGRKRVVLVSGFAGVSHVALRAGGPRTWRHSTWCWCVLAHSVCVCAVGVRCQDFFQG